MLTQAADMPGLSFPKHAVIFLRKKLEDCEYRVAAISASALLKRHTDSVPSTLENDLFASLPDDTLLDEPEEAWNNRSFEIKSRESVDRSILADYNSFE